MRLTIFEAMEVGLFQVPFHPDNPYLFFAFWLCFALAVGIQLLLFKKCKGQGRWFFLLLSLCGFLLCEVACQLITGWDLLAWLLLWFLCLTFLLGAGLCTLLRFLLKKHC
ncbi:hypothetical protein [Anaerotignum sp.]|nr:hypothetical protein [Anaerotignum sp.]MBQ7757863.1 hypothetical protein [Anaerotignum sp.]